MSRARYVSNSRIGPPGTLVQGNIIHEPIDGMDVGIPDKTSTTALYPIGTRVVTPDGRVFRYSLSSGAVSAGRGEKSAGTIASDGISASSSGAEAIGATSITFASQTFALNELRGGYLVIYSATNTYQQRYIIGNTVAANANVTVYFDAPLTTATSATFCEACPNPYRFVEKASGELSNYASFLGVSHVVIAAAGTYFWLQTWGPCWMNPGPYGVGGSAGERDVLFNPDGSLRNFAEWGVVSGWQKAGFIIQSDESHANGPPFVMLQVSP